MSQPHPTATPDARHAPAQWHIPQAIAAWAVPGLGHFLLGERLRAAVFAISIGSAYLAGFLLGGISVFDHEERTEQIVAFGQMFLGPCVAADWAFQHVIKPRAPGTPLPSIPHGYEPSFGRVNEQGVLYTSIAGWLNLLVVLDVLYRDPYRRRSDSRSLPAEAPA